MSPKSELGYDTLWKNKYNSLIENGMNNLQSIREIYGIEKYDDDNVIISINDLEQYFEYIGTGNSTIQELNGVLMYQNNKWTFGTYNQKNERSLCVRMVSMGFQTLGNGESYSSILVDNIEYSCKGRGLNCAVINEKYNIVDVFNIDTHGDPELKISRSRLFS